MPVSRTGEVSIPARAQGPSNTSGLWWCYIDASGFQFQPGHKARATLPSLTTYYYSVFKELCERLSYSSLSTSHPTTILLPVQALSTPPPPVFRACERLPYLARHRGPRKHQSTCMCFDGVLGVGHGLFQFQPGHKARATCPSPRNTHILCPVLEEWSWATTPTGPPTPGSAQGRIVRSGTRHA